VNAGPLATVVVVGGVASVVAEDSVAGDVVEVVAVVDVLVVDVDVLVVDVLEVDVEGGAGEAATSDVLVPEPDPPNTLV
jgi:hypothetical protein